VKRLIGRTNLEDALKKLDYLTQEEARMATAETLKATHAVDNRVAGVGDRVAGVADRVAGIDDKVASVNDRVTVVDDRVRVVDDKVSVVINGMENHLQSVVNDMINPNLPRPKRGKCGHPGHSQLC
jgi:hypothetical protein